MSPQELKRKSICNSKKLWDTRIRILVRNSLFRLSTCIPVWTTSRFCGGEQTKAKPHFVSFISKCFQFDGCAKTTQTYIRQGRQASHSREAVMRTNTVWSRFLRRGPPNWKSVLRRAHYFSVDNNSQEWSKSPKTPKQLKGKQLNQLYIQKYMIKVSCESLIHLGQVNKNSAISQTKHIKCK